jgi:xylan 1,4-beta-xylosidase
MNMITNPILRGFNPDPSILRVGDDYFIATSTFEWFPGVQIHHSKDLVHWKLITHPLSRASQLDMLGNVDSGGIWAPCLSWHDGVFYLIYTDVKNWRHNYKESHNYMVTAPDIMGPWSEPIYLNSSGFDPSLFHDDDGRKWLVNMLWDFRAGGVPGYFAGILLQEFDARTKKLVGPIRNIFQGSPIGWVEGPHLYKHNGYYYLMTAEGGTGWNHATTMARSKTIDGPYEIDPQNPVVTSHGKPDLELQKAGHASIVSTQHDDWYLVHLCSRPVGPERRCILGRETAIQKCVWTDDGWLRLEHGGNNPQVSVPAPNLPAHPFEEEPVRDDFDADTLNVNFQSLRVPADQSWCSLTERSGWLRLYGRESLSSQHRQSLIARRVQAFRCEASTCLEFEPETFQQTAGLTAFYDVTTHYYLYVTYDEGKHLNLLAMDLYKLSFPLTQTVKIDGWKRVYLKVTFDYATLQFAYSQDGVKWQNIGPALDATKLSDDYGPESFTGAFIGLCAQDLSGQLKHADFDWFEYREETSE